MSDASDSYSECSVVDDGLSGSHQPFLSVVVPAYNEQARLPNTLAAIAAFLCAQEYTSEVIVADDGSQDDTVAAARAEADSFQHLSVLELDHRGKAAAVRRGILAATGRNVLFTDADLSTPIEAVQALLDQRANGFDVAIGSREGAIAQRIGEPHYRHIMGRAFNWVVRLAAVRGIKDTQCGFKLVSRQVALDVVPRLRVSQPRSAISGPRVSAFDVELLFLARQRGYRIAEVPVVWTHAHGSKVRPGIDALRMFGDVLAVRWNALRGKYN